MTILNFLKNNNLSDAKNTLYNRLSDLANHSLDEKKEKIAKSYFGQQNEDLEQIDELSKNLLGRYATKSHQMAVSYTAGTPKSPMYPHGNRAKEYVKDVIDKMTKYTKRRNKGVKMAINKLSGNAKVNATEETETLDELSKKTLGSNIKVMLKKPMRLTPSQRAAKDRLNHKFSDDIGGSSSNYKPPYFRKEEYDFKSYQAAEKEERLTETSYDYFPGFKKMLYGKDKYLYYKDKIDDDFLKDILGVKSPFKADDSFRSKEFSKKYNPSEYGRGVTVYNTKSGKMYIKKVVIGGKTHYLLVKNPKELVKEEIINELSKKTLGSYIKKASVDAAKKATKSEYSRSMAHQPNNPLARKHNLTFDTSKKLHDKSRSRLRGIEKATDKLTREDRLDELSRKTLGSYIFKASDDLKDRTRKWKMGDSDEVKKKTLKKINNRDKGIGLALKKAYKKIDTNEDRLDELSFKKLGQYSSKVKSDIEHQEAHLKRPLITTPEKNKRLGILKKRKQGVKLLHKAIDRKI